MIERRFVIEEQKFGTQRVVTYALLAMFAIVTGWVFYQDDQAERSTVLQTIINFTMLAIGFWLGSSKGAADNREQLNKLMAPQPPAPIKTESVSIDSEQTTVTTGEAKP